MASSKNFTEVLIGGKVFTLSGFESEVEAKDKEMYDLKHELISVQIKLENADKALDKLKEENKALQMKIVQLETEMKNKKSK